MNRCDRHGLRSDKRDLAEVTDDGEHELATCYAIKRLGLVVIASCSHRGILNFVRLAQAISGISNVHMVIGGFHLVRPRTEEEARQSVAAFKVMDPDYIVPMHCTGEIFIEEALSQMPQKAAEGLLFRAADGRPLPQHAQSGLIEHYAHSKVGSVG